MRKLGGLLSGRPIGRTFVCLGSSAGLPLLRQRVVNVRLADQAVLVEKQHLDDMRAGDADMVDRNAVDSAQHVEHGELDVVEYLKALLHVGAQRRLALHGAAGVMAQPRNQGEWKITSLV